MKKNLLIALMLVFANICFAQNTQQTKPQDGPPCNIASLRGFNLKMVEPLMINKVKHNLIFVATNVPSNKNAVQNIFLAPNNFTGINEKGKQHLVYPAEVRKLVYHNLGDDSKSFCGLITVENVYDNEGRIKGLKYKETVVPDEIAQKIIDLIANDTKWTNKTHIMFYETPDKNLLPTQIR